MKIKIISNEERKLDLNWDRINLYVSRWVAGTAFEIEITKRQPRKSTPLQGYYFGAVLPPIMEQAGYEVDEKLELHRLLKIRYFNVEPDKKWGVHLDKDIPSVFGDDSELAVSIKKAFVDHVIRQAAKVDIYIPDPGRN